MAIIGTGIAGMACGYFLKDRFDITFYEKNFTAGGHTNTVTIDEEGKPVFIDTGFMVYNEITYPHLTRFFRELEIPTKPTSMSFSVQHLPSGLEYCGTGLAGLFAQRKNILNPRFLRMLFEIRRFNQQSVEVLSHGEYSDDTLEDYAKKKKMGEDFLNKYLLPMSSAVWSTEPGPMRRFPIVTLVRFFKNHGLLGLTTHFEWRTLVGGSRVYRDKVLSFFNGRVLLGQAAVQVARQGEKVKVKDSKNAERIYDHAILACHADQALGILSDATDLERHLLKNFRYQKNRATLHTDESIMPKTKRAWSSWNYRIEIDGHGRARPTTVYYMNSLQQVSDKKNYFVSINDPGGIDPKKILWETEYEHPIYDREAVKAQEGLPLLNGGRSLFFCGSYFRYGFHEDAFDSGLEVCRRLTGENIWP